MDCGFPLIKYEKNGTPRDWGHAHGEEWKTAIKELVAIRKELMLQRNPRLEKQIDSLALQQFSMTQEFSPDLAEELRGIAQGAGITTSDIVILNNYTDFRDIELPEEGCSTVYVQRDGKSWAGQTWDMHRSAKDYVCLIHAPATEMAPEMICFSLVGCVGMMGVNSSMALVGVNNINTKNAKAGIIWPAFVRHTLKKTKITGLAKQMKNPPVTSGHSYLLAAKDGGEIWEVSPGLSERTGSIVGDESGHIFHTNHCLGVETQKREVATGINSTTTIRYDLLEKKLDSVHQFQDLLKLFKDHENYPKSICSHFESGSQDPSFTCGGGALDVQGAVVNFWRGCPDHDENFREYQFSFDQTFRQL